ncbi:MAG: DUF1849 family protein [Geminicoccaceae bacterium]
MKKSSLLAAIAVATAVGSTSFEAAAVDLLSHRAAYRLSLHDALASGGIVGVRGALVMEWRASCEGWISNQQLGFVADTQGGDDFMYDVRFTSWESRDHSTLRFNVRSFDGGQPFEEISGKAKLGTVGLGGVAHYDKPEESSIDLPEGTIFPTLHMNRLVEAAQAGEFVMTHEVFDGSDPEIVSTVSAFIGQARVSTVDTAAGKEQRWPVQLAYYSGKSGVDTPDFQISFDLNERGVLYDIVFDYGDFALQADLEEMEAYETPVCE